MISRRLSPRVFSTPGGRLKNWRSRRTGMHQGYAASALLAFGSPAGGLQTSAWSASRSRATESSSLVGSGFAASAFAAGLALSPSPVVIRAAGKPTRAPRRSRRRGEFLFTMAPRGRQAPSNYVGAGSADYVTERRTEGKISLARLP